MIHLAVSLDVRSYRNLPTGSGFPSRGGVRNIHVQADWDRSVTLLELACPQVEKLARVLILLLTGSYSETGHAFASQISPAYSAIVRSLENFPEPATFKIALLAHDWGLA